MQIEHRWLPLVWCFAAASGLAACDDSTPVAVHHGSGGGGNAGTDGANPGGGASANGGALASVGGSAAAGVSNSGGAGTDATAGMPGGGTAGIDATAGMSGGGAAGAGVSGAGAGGDATGTGGTGGASPMCPVPPATHSTTPCTRSCWSTSASDCANYVDWGILNPPVNAADGVAASRFSTGVPQATPAIYQIDLGSLVSIDGIKLDSGTDPTDFAQSYQVEVSTNAIAWKLVACGAGASVTDVAFTP
ncbi:MAG TPA: discoidin domain-containing protein, partial [Polyangiaceae bacterium]